MKEGYRIFLHKGDDYKFYGIHLVKMQDGKLRRSRYEYVAFGKTPDKLIQDLEKMLRQAKKHRKTVLKPDEVPEIEI